MQLEDTICYCFHVTKRKIVNHLRVHQPRRASQLSQCGGAGTGCGWCVSALKRYFAEFEEQGTVSDDEMTPEQYAQQRASYIRAGKGTPATGAVPLPPDAES